MRDTRKIKALKSQLSKLIEEKDLLRIEIQNKQKEQEARNKSISRLQEEINKLDTNGELKLSEHAIIRYLERVEGINIEAIEEKIITPEILRMIETLGGNGKFPLGEHTLILKDYTITTIV